MPDNDEIYQRTLSDLQMRRSKCIEELRKLDDAIQALTATMPSSAPVITPSTVSRIDRDEEISLPDEQPDELYKSMSVRWAILKLFCEHLEPGVTAATPIISALLQQGGNAKATKPTVSAVISDMVNIRKELDSNESGYQLTANGRAAWNAISRSTKYLSRDSNEP